MRPPELFGDRFGHVQQHRDGAFRVLEHPLALLRNRQEKLGHGVQLLVRVDHREPRCRFEIGDFHALLRRIGDALNLGIERPAIPGAEGSGPCREFISRGGGETRGGPVFGTTQYPPCTDLRSVL